MADEKLQYQVTFKTRAEGAGAQQTTAAVRDLRAETERMNALATVTAQKVGANEAAYYDLSQSISANTTAVKVSYTAGKADDAQKARAIQTTRQLREEEAKRTAQLNATAAAAGTAGKAARGMGGQVQNVAFQVQDLGVQLAAGTSAATAFAQQLPQLLGGFGAGGAIAGGVVALGALAYKLATAGANTKEADEALKKYNEQLDELIAKKADEFVTAYALALDTAAERQNDLREAEVAALGTAAEVESANRRKEKAQEDLTASLLRYQEAMTGVDNSAAIAALKQGEFAREAEQATAAQTLKLAEQTKIFENLWVRINELKTETNAWKQEVDDLNAKAGELSSAADLAGRTNQPGAQLAAQRELANVQAKVEEIERRIQSGAADLASLDSAATRAMIQIDEVRATTTANIGAINAELDAKVGEAQLQETIAQNQKLTGDLTKALGDFQATTPAQAQAAADLSVAVSDGKLNSEELARLSGQLATLGGSFNVTVQGNTRLVDNLLAAVEDLAAKQKAQEARIEGLKNRR